MSIESFDLDLEPFRPVVRHMVLPFIRNTLAKVTKWRNDSDDATAAQENGVELTEDLNEANVVTSMIRDSNLHTVVLDIDIPAALVPSTTPGKHHLYIDAPMPWSTYETLLKALADAGVIEEGYALASMSRGFTSVRLPWVRKMG